MQKDAPKAKYVHTKEQVQNACDVHGLTQTKIAKLCNVQQSTVSDWLNGRKLARQEQIAPLIETYGTIESEANISTYLVYEKDYYTVNLEVIATLHKNRDLAIQKKSSSDYSAELTRDIGTSFRHPKRISDPELRQKFETEISKYEEQLNHYQDAASKAKQQLRQLEIDDLDNFIANMWGWLEKGKKWENKNDFLKLFSDLRPRVYDPLHTMINYQNIKNDALASAHVYDSQIVQIHGEIIFEFTLDTPPKDPDHRFYRSEDNIPWMRWIVHELGGGKFCWLVQQPKGIYLPLNDIKKPSNVWLSKIQVPDTIEEIIRSAKDYFSPDELLRVDLESLVFMLKKSFLDRGYPVEGVKILSNINT